MTTPTSTKEPPLFDPLATTPATNLAAPLPPDLDAEVLVIGGKDVRSLLYTAWGEVGPGLYGDGQHGGGREDGEGEGQQKDVGEGQPSDAGNGQSDVGEAKLGEMKLEESRSLRKRKIDITVSHEDKYVVARNVLVLSLILGLEADKDEEVEEAVKQGDVQGAAEEAASKETASKETTSEETAKETTTKQTTQKEKLRRIWNIYYSRFLHDSETRQLLAQQSAKLCELSQTLSSWSRGPYGSTLHFINQKSLDAVRGVWGQYAWAATVSPDPAQEKEKSEKLAEAMVQGMKSSSPDERRSWASSGSSTAPITILLRNKIRNYVRGDWELDQYYAEDKEEEEDFANPMFVCGLLSDSLSTTESESGSSGNESHGCRKLAYPSNGVLGYYLALNTKVHLEELSPLRMDATDSTDTTTKGDSNKKVELDTLSFIGYGDSDERDADGNVTALGVARHQFIEWSLAFLSLATASTKRFTIRFAVDGWFSLCQSFVKEKRQFDVIDTTDLSVSPFSSSKENAFWSPFSAGVADPPGILGLLVAAKRLLKDRASSTLVIDDGEGESSLAVDDPKGDDADNDEHTKSQAETSSVSKANPSKTTTLDTTSMFLLGLTAVEYWTNASVRSTLDDCLDAAASRFYNDDNEKNQGLVKNKANDKEAAAVRVKRMEEEGRLQIRNRLFVKHSRWLVDPGQNGPKLSERGLFADAQELMEVAWRVFQDLVILKVEGQKMKYQGQEEELIKVSWGEGLWKTLLDFLKVVVGQFQVETKTDNGEQLRRVILEKIGGNETQDHLLREALDLGRVSEGTTEAEADDGPGPLLTANFDVTSGTLKTITAHLDFVSEEDKRFLADKSIPIRLRQASPWTIDIVFGNEKLVNPLVFPTPVLKEGSKTRIARTSGYIEMIAPVILDVQSAAAASVLDDYIFPTVLQPVHDDSSETTAQLIPAPLNCPTVNLDSLPILSLSEASQLEPFFPGLVASTFSPREIGIRKGDSEDHWPVRMQLKDTLHLMANMVTGLQAGHQSGLFALTPHSGGRHILIVVSAIRLDCSAQAGGSIVLDAAVLPITHTLLAEAKKKPSEDDDFDLSTFLAILHNLACIDLDITDAELMLWKSLLPSFAERCRTYPHQPSCEYSTTGQVPLSFKKGDPVLCSCGTGQFPPYYLSLPLWDTVASRYSTRVAISLPYPSPIAEPSIFDPKLAREIAERGLVVKKKEEKCRACGKTEEQLIKEAKEKGGETAGEKGGAEVLKKCKRCLKVRYCGAECQRKDWKTHKTECVESEEHDR